MKNALHPRCRICCREDWSWHHSIHSLFRTSSFHTLAIPIAIYQNMRHSCRPHLFLNTRDFMVLQSTTVKRILSHISMLSNLNAILWKLMLPCLILRFLPTKHLFTSRNCSWVEMPVRFSPKASKIRVQIYQASTYFPGFTG